MQGPREKLMETTVDKIARLEAIGLGGLMAAASSAVFTCRTVWEMRYEQRAWIGGPTITAHRARNEGWAFDYAITNIGKSMPNGLYIGAALVAGPTKRRNQE